MAVSTQQKLALLLLHIFLINVSAKAQSINVKLAPALYVFGDSTVDGGNRLPPNPAYGMDLNSSVPPRWSNGLNIADFHATFLGLPLVPPYNNMSVAGGSTTGVNYGSAGCGILPQTGHPINENGILHGLGGRKFVVNNIWPMGCTPGFSTRQPDGENCCDEKINQLLIPYNNSLPQMLMKLEGTLPGFLFSSCDDFQFIADLKMNEAQYGITHVTGRCLSDSYWGTPCRDRDHECVCAAAALNVSTPLSMDDLLINTEQLGINYASPSSGILPETGTALGVNYCMEKQVNFFNETVETKLRAKFSPTDKLSKYLSASVYLINIGTSDYIHNYLQPHHYNSSRQHNGEDFAELLSKKLENNLKDLYNIGARKMIVFQIGPLGCYPYIINKLKPRSRCAEDINKLVSVSNDKLNGMLKELSEKLDGSSFVTVKTFDLIKRLILSPADYEFAETRWPCCVTQANGTGLCDRGPKYFGSDVPRDVPRISNAMSMEKEYMCRDIRSPRLNSSYSQIGKPVKYICQERDYYLFFDELHLTQAAFKLIVNKCLNSTTSEGICSPYGIYHLAEI
ncbi:hypothetical protein RHMOL_Rhmol09G0173800 [Rhododendron molle]|uniref:Uncharacterized protein n=1 Tax=Rhododendron molle TaxID=49168 RepID=A0ACC0ME42_RHOML|nr:hypothetical protein RHMOL_Rhmol09G0173800 [Rhododendron molle]